VIQPRVKRSSILPIIGEKPDEYVDSNQRRVPRVDPVKKEDSDYKSLLKE
jgi:hypothetical protein